MALYPSLVALSMEKHSLLVSFQEEAPTELVRSCVCVCGVGSSVRMGRVTRERGGGLVVCGFDEMYPILLFVVVYVG